MTEVKTIAHIRTDFKTKFGLPRQSGVVPELCGVIEFTDEYKNAVRCAVLKDIRTFG